LTFAEIRRGIELLLWGKRRTQLEQMAGRLDLTLMTRNVKDLSAPRAHLVVR
jgi:hypothetical protein